MKDHKIKILAAINTVLNRNNEGGIDLIHFLEENSYSILVGIFDALIVALIGSVIKGIIEYIRCKKSNYSGEWEQRIFQINDSKCKGEPIKIDKYIIKHKRIRFTGNVVINIKGEISRVKPIGRKSKRWTFIGYLDSNVLTILYESKEGQRSRGCIYAKLVSDYEFRGYYLEEHIDGKIDKVPLIIKKKDV